jgi:hypothetical protein
MAQREAGSVDALCCHDDAEERLIGFARAAEQ